MSETLDVADFSAGPARGGARPAKPARKAPATQEDLDKELEGFMGRDAAPPAADVEMA